MPEPLQLNHLNLPAADPAALREWYVATLGFTARGRFLWSSGSLLVFVDGAPLREERMHLGFRVSSISALREWVETLRARGVDPGEIEGDENYSTVFFHDPEGNRIELFYEPAPGDE